MFLGLVAVEREEAVMKAARCLRVVAIAVVMLTGVLVHAEDPGAQLRARVDEVLSGKRPLSEVRIDAIWSHRGQTSLTVFGNGVGILSNERQFQVSQKEQRNLLKLFVQHGFFTMPEKPRPPAVASPVNGPAIMRAVTLAVGDLSKSVLQTDRVNTLPALEALVAGLFAGCEKAAKEGLTVASLAEGLDLVAKGKLAPEVLSMVVSQPASATEADALDGFVINIEGGVVTRTPQRTGGLPAVPTRRVLAPEEVREVVTMLRDGGFVGLPGNVFRQRYVDISVRILDRSHHVQARRFAGKDSAAQSTERALIERTITILERLAKAEAAGGSLP